MLLSGYEVMYLTDVEDEYVMQQLTDTPTLLLLLPR
jgi:hypothetical protein